MGDQQLVHITINGIELDVPKGEKIIESARRIGVDIPYFCYHPRLSMEAGANCRMCLVEVAAPRPNPDGTTTLAKFPKPQTACSLPAGEGMVIDTETPVIQEARRGVLEFLLINHPLDCPVCDRGGECPLQNNTLHYGPPTSRYIEEKRRYPKAYPLSAHVVLDRERCIHCARCVRFTTDISGDAQLGFLKRGADMEIGSGAVSKYTSLFSGNVIEICPVGALTSRDYRFSARPWDLATDRSVCWSCSVGCNIKLDHRNRKVLRINARVNEQVNEEWTCDRGKFGLGVYGEADRVTTPLIRRGDRFEPATWDEALAAVAQGIGGSGSGFGAIGGATRSNEDLYLWQKLVREVIGSPNIDSRIGARLGGPDSVLMRRMGWPSVGMPIAGIEEQRAVLVLGSDLANEHPIVYLRLRKAWRQGGVRVVEARPAAAGGEAARGHVGEFAGVRLRYRPGAEEALLRAFRALAADPASDAGPQDATAAGLDVADVRKAAALLSEGPLAIWCGSEVDVSSGEAILGAACDLAEAIGGGSTVHAPVRDANEQGAWDLGVLPGTGPGYAGLAGPALGTGPMLKAAVDGALRALWVLGDDVVADYPDAALAKAALEACPFVVVGATHLTATARMASVVLPLTTPAEYSGTVTNVEGRIQGFDQAYEPICSARPGWQVFAQVAQRLGTLWTLFDEADVRVEIAGAVPLYGAIGEAFGAPEGIRRVIGAGSPVESAS